jgi:hypothetical protein
MYSPWFYYEITGFFYLLVIVPALPLITTAFSFLLPFPSLPQQQFWPGRFSDGEVALLQLERCLPCFLISRSNSNLFILFYAAVGTLLW